MCCTVRLYRPCSWLGPKMAATQSYSNACVESAGVSRTDKLKTKYPRRSNQNAATDLIPGTRGEAQHILLSSAVDSVELQSA